MLDIFVVQSICGIGFSSILDGSVMFTCYAIPVIAYWVSVFVLACRVRFKLGRREVIYINFAWMAILPAGMATALFVHFGGYLR